jgi:hypothetical protein
LLTNDEGETKLIIEHPENIQLYHADAQKLNLHAPMERPQLIQVGLWIKLLGIYYKRNRSKMMPNFLGNTLLEISEITNKTYSVKPNRYLLYWNHQKILGERIEALDEQTQLSS